jgi:hypothetical protein
MALLALAAAPAALAAPLNLYDWMATAPIAVGARVVADDTRYVEVEVMRVARGDLAEGTRLGVDVRSANRDRQRNTPALELAKGRIYLLLLTPLASKQTGPPPRFSLVRGISGAREVPFEGSDLHLDALARFGAIQALREDERVWEGVRGLLDDENPLVVHTALDLLLKYRRGRADDSTRIRELLAHPRADIRELSARALGRLLASSRTTDAAERVALFGDLAARARRDESVPVRVAATESIAVTGAPGVEDLLREIAREDPDQAVRYVAQRALYERKIDGAAPPRSN